MKKAKPGSPLKSAAGTTIFFVLLIAAAPACAEWVKVGPTDQAVHYVDQATVRSDGNLRRVWLMQDLVDERPDGTMSIRALQEHNCADGRFRYLSITSYTRPMAGGQVLVEYDMRDAWSRPVGLSRSAIGKMVCER